MRMRTIGRMAVFVGSAVAVQVSCVLVLLAACPETKPKQIPCDVTQPAKCTAKTEEACKVDWRLVAKHEGLFGSETNSPEQTKTQTDTEPKNKVPCYTKGDCYWWGATECKSSYSTEVVPANPRKQVPC